MTTLALRSAPETTTEPEVTTDLATRALQVVNQTRMRLGADTIGDLPQGYIGSPGQCPLALALRTDDRHVSVAGRYIRFTSIDGAEALAGVLNTGIFEDRGNWCVQIQNTVLSAFALAFDLKDDPSLFKYDLADKD